jgi:nickel-dependent lactate racemase
MKWSWRLLCPTTLLSQFHTMAILRYGTDSSVCLQFAEGVLPGECGTPRGSPLDNLAVAVADVLDDPIDYPPLAQSTTPADRVVLALDRCMPWAAQIAAAVIRALVEAGVHPDGISVLRTRSDVDAGRGDPSRLLPEVVAERITLLAHDPTDRRRLAYLAATKAGEPILLNRAIQEADLVVPIGCLYGAATAGYFGVHTTVYPTFSDRRAAERFGWPGLFEADGSAKRRLASEVDEVAWLLGINFTIQLIPAAGDGVLHVLAGQSEAVRRRSRQLYEAAWSWPVPAPASLVVAGIEGDASQQTWQDFGRALDAAVAVVEDGGSIAVCCDLAEPPGAAVQQMAGARSRRAALRRIHQERLLDALPAAQLARALDRGKVYLLSRLDPSLVDALDMIYVAAPDELARLVRQHRSCILLANAPRAQVSVVPET